MSDEIAPRWRPVRPPRPNTKTTPSENSIGVAKRIEPRHIVPSQFRKNTAEGIEMSIVSVMNPWERSGLMPTTNMWCPYTTMESRQMTLIEIAVALYPNAGFLEKNERRSDTMPQAGRMRM